MGLTSDSSSEDDDDIYISSAARLKALKKKVPLVVEPDSPIVERDKNVIPDFWSSGTSSEQSRITQVNSTGHGCSDDAESLKKREISPDVEITSVSQRVSDNDSLIFEKTTDFLNCTATSLDPEDENYNVDVKVRWKSRAVVRLELRKYESFEKVFKHFAEKEGVSEKQILIMRGNRRIVKTDTPASIELRVIDILEGGIMNTVVEERNDEDTDDNNTCKIKVQMSTKQKILVDLKMGETFKTVVMRCAQELNVAPSRIKLSFDGEEIALTDTPESLDLEQEACIDLRVLTSL